LQRHGQFLHAQSQRPGNIYSFCRFRVAIGFNIVIFIGQMNDRFVALKLFVRVSQSGSFSGAGRELGLSQPSVSRIIADLEANVGAALLTRTTRAVMLTEAGTHYLVRAEAILSAVEEADLEARGTGEFRGTLRVGLASSLAIRGVIPSLPSFMKRHPALKIELLMNDQRQDLVIEGVDVAFRFGKLQDSTAMARRLLAWPIILAASPAYLAERGTPTTPSDLAPHAVIIGPSGVAPTWTFRKDQRVMSIAMEGQLMVTNNEGAIAASLAGLGIMSSASAGCQSELDNGSLVRVLPDWDMGTIELNAVFAGGRAAKPSARALADFLFVSLNELETDRP
jgi:DNA-binding transcriptional LysR family regulator